jgi:Tol biopolymer transport system component
MMKKLLLYSLLVVVLTLFAAGCAAEDDLAVPTLTETIPPTNTIIPSETATLPPPTATITPTQIDPLSLLQGTLYITFPLGNNDRGIYLLSGDELHEVFVDQLIAELQIDPVRKQAVYYQPDFESDVRRNYLLDLETSERTLLSQVSFCTPDLETFGQGADLISLMNDQNMVIFESCQTGDHDLYAYDLDSGEITNITHTPSEDFSPSGSLVDDQIVFLSNRSGRIQLYSMRLNGEEIRQLTDFEGGEFDSSAWSPDGTKIAFQHTSEKDMFSDIYVLNTDGSDQAKLTNSTIEGYWTRGGQDAFRWSPSGTKILFTGLVDEIIQVFCVDLITMEVTQLTDGTMDSRAAAWSPDGTDIVFVYGDWGKFDLYYLDLEGEIGLQMIRTLEFEYVSDIYWFP